MSAAVVSCSGVSKAFPLVDGGLSLRAAFSGKRPLRSIRALEGIELEVPRGEFLGILGRNGAGKSTLLRTLAGVLPPDRGEIRIDGSVCGLFELGGFGNPHITGRQYAERWLALHGIPRRDYQALAEEIADFSELEDRFDSRIRTYSTGMAARLYFATATALRHDVYLIDEILSVGDQHFQDKCWRRLRERFEHGASGVLVTHDWSAALRLCRKSCILERGRIVARGPSEEIIVRYLDLERPDGQVARIGLQAAHRFEVETGQDADLKIPVELAEDVPVAISYAIEAMHVGFGWEILFHENFMPVAGRAGKYEVNLHFDRIPLAPGEYRLSIFVASPESTHGGPDFKVYDTRSWTYGNSLMLAVSGAPRPGALLHPAQWTLAEGDGGDAHQN